MTDRLPALKAGGGAWASGRARRPLVGLLAGIALFIPSLHGAEPTFNRDIAPLLFQHCAPCHRPGQAGPFSLLTYADARKHASDLARVTRGRSMPPWLPEPGPVDFLGARRLTAAQIDLFAAWAAAGTLEGSPADLPPLPRFPEGWQLGPPDLILPLPEAFLLGAEGRDVYRNFVLPVPPAQRRFIRGFEFQPRTRAVHHARVKLDPTRQSRRLDAEDAAPGFAGMRSPGKYPSGHLLAWAPGSVPAFAGPGLAWVLESDTDFVLELHLQRTGKPESIQPVLGLYFTSEPPSRNPVLLGLMSQQIDIPPGEAAHRVERTFRLPVAVEALAIMPHLHYLGRRVEAFAELPPGGRQPLLTIERWDFNWQGEYRFAQPIRLPAGTAVTMRYTYDNSAGNPRNPHQPPRRVQFGPQSADEMAELWLQVMPDTPADARLLQRAAQRMFDEETIAFYENRLRSEPGDPAIHTALGKVLGPNGRLEDAIGHFQQAIRLDRQHAEAYFYLGLSLQTIDELDDAVQAFETVLEIDPNYPKAHSALGVLLANMGQPSRAMPFLERALRLNPADAAAGPLLDRLRRPSPSP